jgi:hypothetical protein
MSGRRSGGSHRLRADINCDPHRRWWLSVIQRSRARQPLTRKRQTLMVWSGEAARPVALIFWAAGLVYHCASFCRCIAGENMALTSKLFAGNQALEAAATQDAAHIQIGPAARTSRRSKPRSTCSMGRGSRWTVPTAPAQRKRCWPIRPSATSSTGPTKRARTTGQPAAAHVPPSTERAPSLAQPRRVASHQPPLRPWP